jgi:hypothetical protein
MLEKIILIHLKKEHLKTMFNGKLIKKTIKYLANETITWLYGKMNKAWMNY